MKTEHERKCTELNKVCEAECKKLTCANCGQPQVPGSTLCADRLPQIENYTFRRWYIPARMMPGIQRYIDEKIKPGRFLTAVICNNLSDAVGQADDENMENLPAYAAYFYNETPAACHGSRRQMDEWLKGGPND